MKKQIHNYRYRQIKIGHSRAKSTFSCYSKTRIFYTIKSQCHGKNILSLDNEQLKAIVCSFRDKTEEGLKTENAEIQCIPTFIAPKTTHIKGKSLVLDLGGTNYRVAIVDFDKATPTVHPNNGWKKTCQL